MSWNRPFLTTELPRLNPVGGLLITNPTIQRASYNTRLDVMGYSTPHRKNGKIAVWLKKVFHIQSK